MFKIIGRILTSAVWIGFAMMILLLVVVPVAISAALSMGYSLNETALEVMRRYHLAQILVMTVFCVAWVFFLGSCFGSFFNVVASRVPRGISVVGSSQCPQCKIELAFARTNMPILGWLNSGGQCANCEAPIPARYIIAEIVLGTAFLILFLAEAATGGATIPFRAITLDSGILGSFFAPDFNVLVTLGLHLTILSLIFTLAIAAMEKFKAPMSLVVLGVLATIGLQCINLAPGIADFRFGAGVDGKVSSGFLSLVKQPADFSIAIALGVAAAAVCFLAIRFSNHSRPLGSFASLLLIGVAFGWQAVLSITVIACLLMCLFRFNVCGLIFAATLLHLCVWRLQLHCQWWPGPASSVGQLICGTVYVGLLTTLYRHLASRILNANEEPSFDLPTTQADLE